MNQNVDLLRRLVCIEEQMTKFKCKCGHGLEHHDRNNIVGWSCSFKLREAKSSIWSNDSLRCNCSKFRII